MTYKSIIPGTTIVIFGLLLGFVLFSSKVLAAPVDIVFTFSDWRGRPAISQLCEISDLQHRVIQESLYTTFTPEDSGSTYRAPLNLRTIATQSNPSGRTGCTEEVTLYSGSRTARFNPPGEDQPNSGTLRLNLGDVWQSEISTGRIGVSDTTGTLTEQVGLDVLQELVSFLENQTNAQLQQILAADIDFTSTAPSAIDQDLAEQRGGCETDAANVPFSVLICPLVEIMFDAIDGLYTRFILPQLAIEPLDTGGGNSASASLYDVWNNFRIIANILFIGVFLLAVIGQAFSWFFTPYELKKIIPRLAIGIIAAQLSWFIAAALVDLFNILGAGTRALMLAPLDGLDSNVNFDFNLLRGVLSGLATGVGTGIVLFTIGIGGIITGLPLILTPIILGLLATFLTIMIRKIAIFLLVVISPIAFVLWILPSTERFYKTWWEFFWKALLVYPIIIALISGGELLGRIITATEAEGESPGVSQSLVGLIAMFAPYFLIPFAFTIAGGALAGISGSVDKMGKNAGARLWGDERDPNSYRGRRKSKIRSKRGTRKANLADGRIRVPMTRRRLRVRPRGDRKSRAYDWAVAKTMPNAYREYAGGLEDAIKAAGEMTGNGPDEVQYAILAHLAGFGAGNHPFKDANGHPVQISAASMAAAKNIWEDRAHNPKAAAAAFSYLLGKTTSTDQIDTLRDRFMGNESLGFDLDTRRDIFQQAVTDPSIQGTMLGLKHMDPTTGRISDAGEQFDFISELNGNNYGGYSMSSQKGVTWNNVDQVLTDIHEAGTNGGATTFDESNLNYSQRSAYREAQTMFNNMGARVTRNNDGSVGVDTSAARALGGPPGSEEAREQMLQNHAAWVLGSQPAVGQNGQQQNPGGQL